MTGDEVDADNPPSIRDDNPKGFSSYPFNGAKHAGDDSSSDTQAESDTDSLETFNNRKRISVIELWRRRERKCLQGLGAPSSTGMHHSSSYIKDLVGQGPRPVAAAVPPPTRLNSAGTDDSTNEHAQVAAGSSLPKQLGHGYFPDYTNLVTPKDCTKSEPLHQFESRRVAPFDVHSERPKAATKQPNEFPQEANLIPTPISRKKRYAQQRRADFLDTWTQRDKNAFSPSASSRTTSSPASVTANFFDVERRGNHKQEGSGVDENSFPRQIGGTPETQCQSPPRRSLSVLEKWKMGMIHTDDFSVSPDRPPSNRKQDESSRVCVQDKGNEGKNDGNTESTKYVGAKTRATSQATPWKKCESPRQISQHHHASGLCSEVMTKEPKGLRDGATSAYIFGTDDLSCHHMGPAAKPADEECDVASSKLSTSSRLVNVAQDVDVEYALLQNATKQNNAPHKMDYLQHQEVSQVDLKNESGVGFSSMDCVLERQTAISGAHKVVCYPDNIGRASEEKPHRALRQGLDPPRRESLGSTVGNASKSMVYVGKATPNKTGKAKFPFEAGSTLSTSPCKRSTRSVVARWTNRDHVTPSIVKQVRNETVAIEATGEIVEAKEDGMNEVPVHTKITALDRAEFSGTMVGLNSESTLHQQHSQSERYNLNHHVGETHGPPKQRVDDKHREESCCYQRSKSPTTGKDEGELMMDHSQETVLSSRSDLSNETAASMPLLASSESSKVRQLASPLTSATSCLEVPTKAAMYASEALKLGKSFGSGTTTPNLANGAGRANLAQFFAGRGDASVHVHRNAPSCTEIEGLIASKLLTLRQPPTFSRIIQGINGDDPSLPSCSPDLTKKTRQTKYDGGQGFCRLPESSVFQPASCTMEATTTAADSRVAESGKGLQLDLDCFASIVYAKVSTAETIAIDKLKMTADSDVKNDGNATDYPFAQETKKLPVTASANACTRTAATPGNHSTSPHSVAAVCAERTSPSSVNNGRSQQDEILKPSLTEQTPDKHMSKNDKAQRGDSPSSKAQETKENHPGSLRRQSYFFKKGKLRAQRRRLDNSPVPTSGTGSSQAPPPPPPQFTEDWRHGNTESSSEDVKRTNNGSNDKHEGTFNRLVSCGLHSISPDSNPTLITSSQIGGPEQPTLEPGNFDASSFSFHAGSAFSGYNVPSANPSPKPTFSTDLHNTLFLTANGDGPPHHELAYHAHDFTNNVLTNPTNPDVSRGHFSKLPITDRREPHGNVMIRNEHGGLAGRYNTSSRFLDAPPNGSFAADNSTVSSAAQSSHAHSSYCSGPSQSFDSCASGSDVYTCEDANLRNRERKDGPSKKAGVLQDELSEAFQNAYQSFGIEKLSDNVSGSVMGIDVQSIRSGLTSGVQAATESLRKFVETRRSCNAMYKADLGCPSRAKLTKSILAKDATFDEGIAIEVEYVSDSDAETESGASTPDQLCDDESREHDIFSLEHATSAESQSLVYLGQFKLGIKRS